MKSNTLLIIVLIFGVALIYGSSHGYLTNINKATVTGSTGLTVTSISTSKVISNDADLASANFIVNTVADGGGQSIIGRTLDSADFKTYLPNLDVQYPLMLQMGNIKETLKYPIRNDGAIYFFQYNYVDRPSYWTGVSCSDYTDWNWCFSIPDAGIDGFVGNDRIMRVYVSQIGNIGSFDNPSIYWDGNAVVTINGVSHTKSIGSAGSPGAVDFYDSTNKWIAQAKWIGSLVTGEATPRPDLYRAVWVNGDNKWKVADHNLYDAVETGYSANYRNTKTLLDSWASTNSRCVGNNDYTCVQVVSAISKVTQSVNSLISDSRQITSTASTGTALGQQSTGGKDDGSIIESLDRQFTIPQITWLVKATELGVLIPIGKPEIVSINVPSFSSGDNNGLAIVTVKNIGTVAGTFAATFTDPSNTFYPTSTTESSRATISPNSQGTINVYIGHGATALSTSKTATMRVYDVNKPTNSDTRDFTISMTAPKACVPGTLRTDGKIAYKCKPDGSGEEIIASCNINQELVWDGTTYKCRDATTLPTPTVTTNNTIPSDTTVTKWFENTWLIIGALITIFSYAYYRSKK